MPILCSVRAILRPMRFLQEHNVWPVQLQPNKEFGVEGRREAAAIVAQDAEPAVVAPLGWCMDGQLRRFRCGTDTSRPLMGLHTQHATSIMSYTGTLCITDSLLQGIFPYLLGRMQQYMAFTAIFHSHVTT